MVQAKSNRDLASLGADLASSDVNEGYRTCSKTKGNSRVQDTEKNNVLPPQEPSHNYNDGALVGAATVLSLLFPTTDTSNSQHINQNHMKSYYVHIHCCFLDYFITPFQMMKKSTLVTYLSVQ